jgi:glycosyltransferase involved in cell wall biosynthesis
MSTITMLPSQDSGNIYTVLLYRALETVGLRYVQFPVSLSYVLHHGPQSNFHYVHFHWPEVFFHLRPRAWRRLWGLKGYLHIHAVWWALKLRGYRIVWTVHEVDVHDATRLTWMHAASRRLLWKLADIVFTHSPDVRTEAVRRWGAKPHLHTIPIGSYDGAYPSEMTREAARARLGIPAGAFTFVFFGNVRPYKGVDLLIAGFRDLVRDHPEAQLVLAGKPYSAEFRAEVEASLQGVPNVHLALGYVPDDEIQVYLRAADCFVAPYKYIETCSAIYLALAFDLPVIIKSEGNVVDFATQNIGLFLRDASEVGAAMRRMLEMPPAARDRLRANTRAAAALYSWDRLRHTYRDAFDRFESANG